MNLVEIILNVVDNHQVQFIYLFIYLFIKSHT